MRRARPKPRRVKRAVALAALGAVALLAGPLAAKSHAGTYTASECASWNPYSAAQPGESGHHFFGLIRNCAGGGDGLSISLPQAYWAWGFARWTVYAPPGTHMINVSGAQRGVNADNWWVQLHACTPWDCGANIYVSGDGYWRRFGSPAGHYSNWWVQLVCGPGSCFGSTAAGAHVRDVTMTMSDVAPPSVGVGKDSVLLNGEVQRGIGGLNVTPADAGAGLTSAWVSINEQAVARQNYACGGAPMQPCPLSGGTLHFNLDTQGAPFHDGTNTVQVCAADFGAPPNVACTAPRAVKVDNSCTPSKVPGGSDLSAVFPRTGKDRVGVKAGQGAALTGQLTDGAGNAVSGATLCMSEAVAGDPLENVGTLRTNSDGRYRYGVAPGPNRRLQVGYRYNRRQLERHATFFSKLRPKLKLRPKRRARNGKRIRLYGSIPGPSSDGRVVVLQARYPNSRQWNTFAKARTNSKGRYSARYRFTATFVTTRYRMRTVVPAQKGYPYRGGASRVKRIRVIGR
ncbi:MAG: carboxypeptidase-like regulatory domain-containing protein [Pseudonocardiaceae bacterium]